MMIHPTYGGLRFPRTLAFKCELGVMAADASGNLDSLTYLAGGDIPDLGEAVVPAVAGQGLAIL